MKFAKHMVKAMGFSDPEWLPFWVNYRFLKKLLPCKGSPVAPVAPTFTAAHNSAPTPNTAAIATVATATSASTIGHSNGGRDAALMPPPRPPPPAGDATGNADWRQQPRQQQQDAIPSWTAPSPAEEEASGLRGSRVVSRWSRPCLEQQPSLQQPWLPLPSQRHASTRLAVDNTGSSSDSGGSRNSGHRAVAWTSGKRKTLGATINVARCLQPCDKPTCCSHPSSGCAAAAISAAAAAGLCSPVSSASSSSFSAAAVLRSQGKHEEHRQFHAGHKQKPQLEPERKGERAGEGEEQKKGKGRGADRTPALGLRCPFFSALLREIYKCRVFFLQNEDELKARTMRLQFALNQLKNPELSCLSSVEGCHVKLMKACVKFYRDALLLEDFAMVNYTAVIKLLKKRDKLAGGSDQKVFMDQVMAAQPFAMYPGVAERVAQVEEIFREIEDMCFLRTGAGMKSVMKTELTVVEAILQLAQEYEDTKNRVLSVETGATPPPPPGSFRMRMLLRGRSSGGGGKEKESSGGGLEKVEAAISFNRPGAAGEPCRTGAPARMSSASPSAIDQSAVDTRRGELGARMASEMLGARRRSTGDGKQRCDSGRGGSEGARNAWYPPSARGSVNHRVARLPFSVAAAAAVDSGDSVVLAEGAEVSVTGMVVSATKTPRLSTNAPRLSTTTASLGRGGGGVPKRAKLG